MRARVHAFARAFTAALWAAAAALAPAPAQAAPKASLNLNVGIQGIGGVSDLAASPGAVIGAIELTWTEPRRSGTTAPYSYDVRVSTAGQIPDHAAFLAAKPLSELSGSPVPSPGPPGGQLGFVVTGLEPGVVHYFAIRQLDSLGAFGAWARGGSRNGGNFAAALTAPPLAVTDLAASPGPAEGQVSLSWTAPEPAPLVEHRVHFATFSAADVGGSTTAWYAASAVGIVAASVPPGGRENAVLSVAPGERYWFGVRAVNATGVGAADALSVSGPQAQARGLGVQPVRDLAAAPGPEPGELLLSWTEPHVSSTTAPQGYQIRVSTLGYIEDDAGFLAAPELSAFSSTAPPAYGAGGGGGSLLLGGLLPHVTHYFALRLVDGSTPTLAGAWLRDAATGRNAASGSRPRLVTGLPDPITDLAAAPGAAEGEVSLSWTAPRNRNLVPIASYQLLMATAPVTAFAGSTTAWAAAAAVQPFSPALAPGALETRVQEALYPAATWYFALRSVDAVGELSPLDTLSTAPVQASALPRNFAPAAVASLQAVAGFRRVSVSWPALGAAQKGLDFAHYRLERSTDAAAYVAVATTVANAHMDAPLIAGVTYYFRVAARDHGGYESMGPVAWTVPFAPGPMEPLGLQVQSSSSTTTLSWSPVARYIDGEPFMDPSAPEIDELLGYRVLRATDPCAGAFPVLSTMAYSSTTFIDETMGQSYFYRVEAFNSQGVSTASLTLSALGERDYFLDDCAGFLRVDPQGAAALNAATNGLGADVRIHATVRTQEVGGQVFQSAEWRPLLGGVSELKNFALPKPARVALRFQVDADGAPVPAGAAPAASRPSAASAKNLGVYWFNGAEYKKLYGVVDTAANTVSVETPNVGLFQIRSLHRADGAVFDLSNVSGRVITPNGDGLNDVFILTYDPGPRNAQVSGKVFDVNGGFVADMAPGLVPNTIVWDGRMNGRAAAGGVYVYRVTGDGKTFTGTVVVAR